MTRRQDRSRAGHVSANGTTLYADVRGSGPALLFIHGGSEDADDWLALGRRFVSRTVVTYDRRGTRRSGRDDWPGLGATQHADDAAALLDALEIDRATVFGSSSGALVALRLAIRHPDRVLQTFAWEPAAIRVAPAGVELHRRLQREAEQHLKAHPHDWQRARERVWQALLDPAYEHREEGGGGGAPPIGPRDQRDDARAEPFMRDDLPILSGEPVDQATLKNAPGEILFAFGGMTEPLFVTIARKLAALRGATAEAVEGASHDAQDYPEAVSSYIAGRLRG